jgi:hypothetical protein
VKTFRPEQPFLVSLLTDLGVSAASRPATDGLAQALTATRLSAIAQVEAAIDVARGPLVQTACLGCARHLVPRARTFELDNRSTWLKRLIGD